MDQNQQYGDGRQAARNVPAPEKKQEQRPQAPAGELRDEKQASLGGHARRFVQQPRSEGIAGKERYVAEVILAQHRWTPVTSRRDGLIPAAVPSTERVIRPRQRVLT